MAELGKKKFVRSSELMDEYPDNLARSVFLAEFILLILFLSVRGISVTPYQPKQVESTYVEAAGIEVAKELEVPPPPKPQVTVQVTENATGGEEAEEVEIAPTTVFSELEAPPPATDTTVYDYAVVEVKPQYKKTVPPKYPELARKAGIEGTVFVLAIVGPDGKVRSATVAKSDNPIFNDAAIEAVMQFEFTPAIQQDRPVACKVIVPVRFQLR
uniref:Energy transducer TonB n=1 Tax=candidate division WOR-3 bacterium TaxID=2052148 RepID=A0A7C2K374_UNCW3